MEFKVNSKQFEKILSKVYPVVPTKTTMAILQNFFFDIKDGLLTVLATDTEIAVKSQINIASEKNKQFFVPAKLLYETVRALPDTVITLKLELNNQLKLSFDRGNYNLSYIETIEYPEIPEVSDDNGITILSEDLKRALDKTAFAISDEDVRPAMAGILLEFAEDGLRFVATDSHKLVKYNNKIYETELREQYIIPRKAVHILSKFLTDGDVKINLTKTHASFKMTDFEFITRLIGEKYPNYNSVIPLENENILILNRAELNSTIKRMLVFASEDNKQVRISIDTNEVKISTESIETSSSATESLDCEYKGTPMIIGFNVFYLNELITHVDSEKLVFKLHSPLKACLVEPSEFSENEEIVMLLMPMRLNN
jgi:DNA polymerase-3 subunit beta